MCQASHGRKRAGRGASTNTDVRIRYHPSLPVPLPPFSFRTPSSQFIFLEFRGPLSSPSQEYEYAQAKGFVLVEACRGRRHRRHRRHRIQIQIRETRETKTTNQNYSRL
jgi:hypothetical protein